MQTGLPLNPNVDYIAIGILMLNSAFDPLLYAAIRKPVRKGYMEIMKWTVYCMLCFAPWLKPKDNFGTRVVCNCASMHISKIAYIFNVAFYR